MDDWKTVIEAEPWRCPVTDQTNVRPMSTPFSAEAKFAAMYPILTTLLRKARRSEVTIASESYVLFAWDNSFMGVSAWLSPIFPVVVPAGAASAHQTLLENFGGISERFNEPDGNWLLKHNQALTANEISRRATFVEDYAWAFEECGGIPINLTEYYPVAWEANGNCVLCSQATGELLFFAPDHADKNLKPFQNCPMFTLHTHREVKTLPEWVENIASQWLGWCS